MSENDNQNTLGEDNKKIEEIGEKIDREESKEDKLQDEKQVKQKEDKEHVDKTGENEEKAQENSRALLGLFYFLALGFCEKVKTPSVTT